MKINSLCRKAKICLLLWITACLASCNYHFGHGELASHYTTISVPFADGDTDGSLTAEIIKKISTSGAFRYQVCDGDLLLKIKLKEIEDLNIGYRYDRKRDDRLKHSIIPSESRFILYAEVSVFDSRKNELIRGPTLIRANLDFDFDYYKVQHEANVFSLGQLNDVDSARDAARHPLNSRLAENIVEYLVNSW
jgi:hypothetical protein